jgi:hypothetical protein
MSELFTTKSGRQVTLPTLTVSPSEVSSLMRLQEDYTERGEHLSLLGVLLDVLDKGKRQVRNQWKNGDLGKNRRDFAKAAAPFMRDPAKYAKELANLAIIHQLIPGTPVELSGDPVDADDLESAELEQLTSPEKA